MKAITVVLLGIAAACVICCRPIDGARRPLGPDAGGAGDAAVGDAAVGDAVAEDAVAGDAAAGDAVAGDAVAGDDNAEIVSFEFPVSIACGEMAQAWVQVKNTGATTWTRDAGYKLGAVGDSDPLSQDTRILLPEETSVTPGATWQFNLSLLAPAQAGTHLSEWQMVREYVAWFGQSIAPTVNVDCEPTVPTPNRFDVVQQVASEYGHLLDTNTWESCGVFVQRVLMALNDPDWGHVGKTEGEGQYSPPAFEHWVDGYLITGFSHDVIWHLPSNRQVDIIINAAANSDPDPSIWGPANVGWEEIPREYYRANNPWLPAVPVGE